MNQKQARMADAMKRHLRTLLAAALALGLLAGAPATAEEIVAAPVDAPVGEAEAELMTPDIAMAAIEAEAAENASSIAIRSKTFPDAAFRKYVRVHFDANGSGRLSRAERDSVTEIVVPDMGIADLTGVELFPNLTWLVVSGNRLKKLDLGGNPRLIELDCAGNRLKKLDLRQCLDLETLNCAGNRISQLRLGKIAKLMTAYLQGNRLDHVNLTRCRQLRALAMRKPQPYPPDADGAVYFGDLSLLAGGVLVIDAGTTLTEGGLVIYPQTEPTSVAFETDAVRLTLGTGGALAPVLSPANASTTYTWQSSRKKVATVDADGVVTPVGAGMATITVTTENGLTAAYTVNVALNRPINIAHRGGAGYWPENTLEAFRNAASTGADAIELDVQTTKDGVQVVNHNEYITAGGRRYTIRQETYKRLRALKPDLCSLSQALKVIRASGLELHLELKTTAKPASCVKLVRKWGMRNRTVYISFERDLLAKVRALEPDARLGYIMSTTPADLPAVIAQLRPHVLAQSRLYLTRDNIARWRESGILVGVWTVDDGGEIRRWADAGVDFITSNYPGRVSDALGLS